MASELLIKWLNGKRNYTVGLVLYNQFGNDDGVKKQLDTGKSEYTEKLLLQHMNNLVAGEEKKEPEAVTITFDAMPDDVDAVLQSLKNKWMPLYTEMNYKRHALDKLLNEEFDWAAVKRSELARDILSLEQKCMGIWHERDYYVKHQQLPGKSIDAEVVADPFMAAKRIENLKIYVRRYRNASAKNPADSKAAELLKQYQDELTKLEAAHG